ncbi:YaiI/YqxD family protein [Vibrio sp. V27_P1S3P104]|uniref:YaiI/YqxD family protein n=1 Tax=Vibrio TaxID=662 RepID=UPI000C16AA9B|nr:MULTISPECIES: YaiI/YqxD family protein [Vibrio]NAW68398.1 YaiI/YqxD family protein [Vibrio sp. V28_P6S34P95]NAX05504.1 YaiI/YqxD family protein [Vibrio sp. V30_P3S12P165]NAX33889.1 YaiI/YqxD family protein [Vibrio sp. V29_P1S30P107]NAX38209.1 YaiI/YqxD family protein [Vibrio sp. V27_P1S3P104]NAX40596.1 YaiI/YqxD family protein [Vibrio sp. V26_P1S5P106]
MRIWVDADACPKVIRETLIRAAERTGVECTFVANHLIPLPKRANIFVLQVPAGFDIADNEIVKRVAPHDLVITSDIPLADEVISKGALALSPRGELFTTETIKARLNIRDFLDTMRSSGIQTGGPSALSQTERREFANHLDRWLTKRR